MTPTTVDMEVIHQCIVYTTKDCYILRNLYWERNAPRYLYLAMSLLPMSVQNRITLTFI